MTQLAYSSPAAYGSNIIQFPGHTQKPTCTRKVSGHLTKTVQPIKDMEQIRAMHRYLLAQAKGAATPSKARNAYRNWLFFALGINLGFRGGDISELTWDRLVNYDPRSNTYSIRRDSFNYIHAEKTGKATFVYVNQNAEEYIDFYLKATHPLGVRPYPDTPVFASNKASGTRDAQVTGHIDCDYIGRILKKAAKAVGIEQPICTHSLRKTFGYQHYKEHGDIITLQKIFGHSSPAVTLNYIGMDAEVLANAYESIPDTGISDLDDYLYKETGTSSSSPVAQKLESSVGSASLGGSSMCNSSMHGSSMCNSFKRSSLKHSSSKYDDSFMKYSADRYPLHAPVSSS